MAFLMPAQTAGDPGREAASPACALATAPNSPADLVVMAVGIRPNIELARRPGSHCERGIVVYDTMQTYDGASTRSANACSTAARPMASSRRCSTRRRSAPIISPLRASATYEGSVVSTKLKVTGIDLFSAGDFARRRRTRKRSCCRTPTAASTRSIIMRGRQDRRRRALRRHHRRPLVLPAAARRHRRSAIARHGWCSAQPISATAVTPARIRSPP